jgi:hypothetical protein
MTRIDESTSDTPIAFQTGGKLRISTEGLEAESSLQVGKDALATALRFLFPERHARQIALEGAAKAVASGAALSSEQLVFLGPMLAEYERKAANIDKVVALAEEDIRRIRQLRLPTGTSTTTTERPNDTGVRASSTPKDWKDRFIADVEADARGAPN